MVKVYLLVGVPGAGKSWVCSQLAGRFRHIPHDSYQLGGYVDAIKAAAKDGGHPILAETPFSISKVREPLEADGFEVECVYIIEPEKILAERYRRREGKDTSKGNLTRQKTYLVRALQDCAFHGTAAEVLEYLKKKGA